MASENSLRESVWERLRFPAEATMVTVSAIAEKWGVARAQVFHILEKKRMRVFNVSSRFGKNSARRNHHRVYIDDYYRACIDRQEDGLVFEQIDTSPTLFDMSQYKNKPEDGKLREG